MDSTHAEDYSGNASGSGNGSDMKDSAISILSVNVCGLELRSKLANHVFKEECCKHKILCFYETKMDDLDIEWITTQLSQMGFKVLIKNRHKVSTRRSGGIVVAVDRKLCIEHKKNRL